MKRALLFALLGLALPQRATADFITLAAPGANDTFARGINDFGVVVGVANFTPNGTNGNGTEGFTWTAAGGYTFFDIGTYGISPYGINNSGQIVGLYSTINGGGSFLRGADGSVTFISVEANGINNAGYIVGGGFLRDPSGNYTTLNLPNAADAIGINNLDQIVGGYNSNGQSFLREVNGQLTTVAVPGAASTLAEGINDSGQITGVYQTNSGSHPFIMNPDGSYITPDVPGSNAAYGINNSGQIVGTYEQGGILYGYVYSPGPAPSATPAPSSLVLVSIGIAIMAGFGWRRSKQSA